MLRTGVRWRDLLERYDPYTTAYNCFNRSAKAGIWIGVFEALAARSPGSPEFVDSSIIRAHQHAAGGNRGGPDHAIGRSRRGSSTEINALVDSRGLPVRIVPSPGQASDKAAVPLLFDGRKAGDVVADRGHDAGAILDLVAAHGGRRTSRPVRIAVCSDPSTGNSTEGATSSSDSSAN
jgi:transposase